MKAITNPTANSLTVAIALLGSLVASVKGATNLVLNGDFEGNNVPNGTAAPSTDPVSWTVTSGDTDLVNSFLGVVGSNGPTWLEIGGTDSPSPKTVFEQSIAITVQGSYDWGFDYSKWQNGGQFPIGFTLIDTSNNSIVDSVTATPGPVNGVWQQYRNSGTLDSGKTYIFRFTDAGVGGTDLQGGVLDNAFLAAVPEPSAMALLGLGGFGFIFKRSRR